MKNIEKEEGQRIIAKVEKIIKFDEKSSKYFFNREKNVSRKTNKYKPIKQERVRR